MKPEGDDGSDSQTVPTRTVLIPIARVSQSGNAAAETLRYAWEEARRHALPAILRLPGLVEAARLIENTDIYRVKLAPAVVSQLAHGSARCHSTVSTPSRTWLLKSQ